MKIAIGVVLTLIALSGLLMFADRAAQAEGVNPDSAVSNKLDHVLENQKAILKELASIKEELNIIKIRVTR